MGFSFKNKAVRSPWTHYVNAGTPVNSGVIICQFKHLSLNMFKLLKSKFTANPPILCNFYDYRDNTLYEGVTLRGLKDDYVEGIEDYENVENTQQKVVSGQFEVLVNSPSEPS